MAVDEMNAKERHNVGVLRGSRRLLVLLILMAVVGAVAVVARRTAPLRTTAGPPGWRVFHEPAKDWTLQYPETWRARRIKESSRGGPYDTHGYGIIVHNSDRPLTRSAEQPIFDMTDQPATLVAVQVMWYYGGGFSVHCPEWGTPLPLSLAGAERVTSPPDARDPLQEQFFQPFIARHEARYSIYAWVGSESSRADRAKLDRIVSSISFDDAPREMNRPRRLCSA